MTSTEPTSPTTTGGKPTPLDPTTTGGKPTPLGDPKS